MQCLRGMAAMSVFIMHMRFHPFGPSDPSDPAFNIVLKGFLGVDVFFVISGFVLAWSAVLSREGSPVSAIEFGIKRAFRVAPAFWASMAVFAYLLGQNVIHEHLLKMIAFYPIGDVPAPYYSAPLNQVGWTLIYEMGFYAIFSLCLFFGWHAVWATTIAICSLVTVSPFVHGQPFTLDPNVGVEFSNMYLRVITNPLMLEFVIGMACAIVYKKYRDRVSLGFSFAAVSVGACFLAISYVIADQRFSLLSAAPQAAVILVGALFAEHKGALRIPPRAVWLGDISFALYLIHWILERLSVKYLTAPEGIIGEWGRVIVMTAVALIVARFWKQYIEDPTAYLARHFVRFLQPIAHNHAEQDDAHGAAEPAKL